LPSFERSNELLRDYFYVLAGVDFAALSVQSVCLISAMRMLGVKAIAMSCLVTLGLLGWAEVAIAILTRGQINRPTTWLLLTCAAVQVVSSVTGVCGFKNLNRECIKWAFVILLVSSAGLVYVVVTSYIWLRDEDTEHPENILLLFAISLVSAFFMYSSLIFGAIFYCKRRRAFDESDNSVQMNAEFSDYSARRPRRPPGRAREYNARSAL